MHLKIVQNERKPSRAPVVRRTGAAEACKEQLHQHWNFRTSPYGAHKYTTPQKKTRAGKEIKEDTDSRKRLSVLKVFPAVPVSFLANLNFTH
jgi:hypothetical protein